MTGIGIAAQILNCIGSTINMVGINIKDKTKVLLFFVAGNTCNAVATGMLGAMVGMLILIVFVIETAINYFWEKKHDKYPLWLILLYVIVPCALSAATFQSVWDLLPIAGGILFPLAMLMHDFKLRFLNFISVIVWIPYNIHIGQYVGAVTCAVFMVINLVAIIRLDVLKKGQNHE